MTETGNTVERLREAERFLYDAEQEATHGKTANAQYIDQCVKQARQIILALHTQASDEGEADG